MIVRGVERLTEGFKPSCGRDAGAAPYGRLPSGRVDLCVSESALASAAEHGGVGGGAQHVRGAILLFGGGSPQPGGLDGGACRRPLWRGAPFRGGGGRE